MFLQAEPLQIGHMIQSIDEDIEQTFLNPEFLNTMVEKQRLGYIYITLPLSSLSEEDWESYRNTGRVPKTYNQRKDKVWTWQVSNRNSVLSALKYRNATHRDKTDKNAFYYAQYESFCYEGKKGEKETKKCQEVQGH